LPYLSVKSRANDTTRFLLKPDLGRALEYESQNLLNDFVVQSPNFLYRDILIVMSGGLSPVAIKHQIQGFLPLFIHHIDDQQWSLAPLIINEKGRVALGDEINHYFKAKITVMLIGERPGLSTPDSMGIYFTYHAKPGCTDEQRNCISNIHTHGISHEKAALKLTHLINKALHLRMTGVELKDEANIPSNFHSSRIKDDKA
jgi:ethanolamine ammonia-lyase small subunit